MIVAIYYIVLIYIIYSKKRTSRETLEVLFNGANTQKEKAVFKENCKTL